MTKENKMGGDYSYHILPPTSKEDSTPPPPASNPKIFTKEEKLTILFYSLIGILILLLGAIMDVMK